MKKDDVKLERIYEKPITVFSKPLRIKKLILISIVGLLLGMVGYLEVKLYLWLVVSFVFAVILIASVLIYQRSIFYFKEYCLEVSPSGDMFITKLHGHCSKCDGHLKIIKKRKGLNKFVSYIQCDKNSQHVWNLHNNE